MNRKNNQRKGKRPLVAEIILKFLIPAIIIVSANMVSAQTNISACGNIVASGEYVLNQSISAAGTCLTVSANDVEIDCEGNTISYDTGGAATMMGINAINGTIARTNLTVRNCVLIKQTNLQTAGYGIRLTRYSNSQLINNTIYTNGTTNNYGIFLTTNSQNNLIENNTIYASGNSTGNHGIYLLTNTNNNTIRSNSISTNGTGTSYGVYISGVTSGSNNNEVSFNNISTAGSGASNYGIYLYRNVSSSNITENTVRTGGTTTDYGISGIGTAGLPVDNNIVDSNDVQTQGSTAGSNYGIYFASNANNNQITNNIIGTNGATTYNYGVYVAGSATLTANNNLIGSNNISTNGTTTNYGIYLLNNANYNNVTGNHITTSGTTAGHGVYVSGATYESKENEISSNTIRTNGTDAAASSNDGIYLYRNASHNRIIRNNISTSGTASSYGIVLVGTTNLPVNDNLIDANNITTSGRTAGNNFGIYLTTNTNLNNITDNDIYTSGTTANYGVYIVGASNLQSDSNLISSNRIRTLGTTTNNYGIAVSTNTNDNTIKENNISTNGTSGNVGIYLTGTTTLPANNNIIQGNSIQTNGSSINNFGIYVLTNSNNNTVSENSISTYGAGTNHGIYLSGTTFTSNGNAILYNSISTGGSGASNYGIHIYRNISFSNVTGNTIQTAGTNSNYGIYLLGTAALRVESNTIAYNSLSVLSADIMRIDTGSRNNTLTGNLILARNSSFYDLNILSAENIGTKLINQSFQRYNFGGAGEMVTVRDNNYGEIAYSQRVTGSGSNLADSIRISSNSVYVNSSQAGLNKSAIITLFNVNYTYPTVLRDGQGCTDCSIISNSQGTIVFSVSHFSSYSISENSRLEISDESEGSTSYGSVKVYANYTNWTNGAPINGSAGICAISFNDSEYSNMSFNQVLRIYEFTQGFATDGTYSYNVNCNGTAQGFAAIELSGSTYFTNEVYGPRNNHQRYFVRTRVNVTNSMPEILNISCNNGSDVTLIAGSTRGIDCIVKTRDFNGGNTISSVNGTYTYFMNSSGDQDDNSVHYTNSSCSRISTDGYNSTWQCSFDLWYYASNGSWTTNISVTDDYPYTRYNSSASSVLPLYAINVTPIIDFGSLAVGDYSPSMDVNVTNLGNIRINVSVFGYGGENRTTGAGLAMRCAYRNISISDERYSTDSLTGYDLMTPLTGNPAVIQGLSLPKQTLPTEQITNITYWKLYVNMTNNPMGVCNGTVIFSAENA